MRCKAPQGLGHHPALSPASAMKAGWGWVVRWGEARSKKLTPPATVRVQYLIKSKTDAYEKRELHVYFDAELVRPSRCASMRALGPPSRDGCDGCAARSTSIWQGAQREQAVRVARGAAVRRSRLAIPVAKASRAEGLNGSAARTHTHTQHLGLQRGSARPWPPRHAAPSARTLCSGTRRGESCSSARQQLRGCSAGTAGPRGRRAVTGWRRAVASSRLASRSYG